MNVTGINCMSYFSMFVVYKATIKFTDENTVHDQAIGIILCLFPKCPSYIRQDKFIIVQVNLQTPLHQVS